MPVNRLIILNHVHFGHVWMTRFVDFLLYKALLSFLPCSTYREWTKLLISTPLPYSPWPSFSVKIVTKIVVIKWQSMRIISSNISTHTYIYIYSYQHISIHTYLGHYLSPTHHHLHNPIISSFWPQKENFQALEAHRFEARVQEAGCWLLKARRWCRFDWIDESMNQWRWRFLSLMKNQVAVVDFSIYFLRLMLLCRLNIGVHFLMWATICDIAAAREPSFCNLQTKM